MASRFADIVSVKQFIEDQENENTKNFAFLSIFEFSILGVSKTPSGAK